MNLKVIAGTAKRTNLKFVTKHTRPLSSRAKSALFSIIAPIIPKSVVLDLYAGSGALGIEALSRGALYAEFVDIERTVTAVIKENLKKTKLEEKAEVFTMPAQIYLRSMKNQDPKNYKLFDIIFIFQPYEITDTKIIREASRVLNNEGIIIFEKEAKREVEKVKGFEIIDTRHYGNIGLVFYKKQDKN
jgi:16S rRNA (guanine966-N2)-methyltransferase